MHRRELLKMLGLTPALPYLETNDHTVSSNLPKYRSSVDNSINLLVYGGTPGGVALAVRTAREGLSVTLVNPTEHLGGMFSSGLGTMDTLYNGSRAPLYDEFRFSIYDYYRSTYGKDSPQFEASLPGNPKTKYESHVAEILINKMVERERNITVVKGYYPVKVKKIGRSIETVEFQELKGSKKMILKADIVADCSYEGDLLVLSGTAYRIGRESKEEYGEKHAGITYTQKNFWPPPADVDKQYLKQVRSMNVVLYENWSELIYPQSTGVADPAIQAFNIRTTLTNDPANRIIPGKPKNYDPQYIKEKFNFVNGAGLRVPNQKTSWNHPEVLGEQNKYVEGNWKEREVIMEKFREVMLGLLYFKQNDPSVSEKDRQRWQEYGLPKNEYTDNGHLPYELYVREARRLIGQQVFTQHDAQLAEGLKRAPVHGDSISITEWFMDSHACTDREIEGSKLEGEVMLQNLTFPGQVSLSNIFPKDLENFIVPVCLSSTHVGWGTIRLEPTWMSIAEAAGYVVSLALKKKTSVIKIDRDELIRTLADNRIMLSFFNDVEGREYAHWYPAIQYLGTKGFFGSYDAGAEDQLNNDLAEEWISHAAKFTGNEKADFTAVARKMLVLEKSGKGTVSAQTFAEKLDRTLSSEGYAKQKAVALLSKLKITTENNITRGDACRLIYESTRIV